MIDVSDSVRLNNLLCDLREILKQQSKCAKKIRSIERLLMAYKIGRHVGVGGDTSGLTSPR
jgi:hypothetical protein